jgi:hypothetical protein
VLRLAESELRLEKREWRGWEGALEGQKQIGARIESIHPFIVGRRPDPGPCLLINGKEEDGFRVDLLFRMIVVSDWSDRRKVARMEVLQFFWN